MTKMLMSATLMGNFIITSGESHSVHLLKYWEAKMPGRAESSCSDNSPWIC